MPSTSKEPLESARLIGMSSSSTSPPTFPESGDRRDEDECEDQDESDDASVSDIVSDSDNQGGRGHNGSAVASEHIILKSINCADLGDYRRWVCTLEATILPVTYAMILSGLSSALLSKNQGEESLNFVNTSGGEVEDSLVNSVIFVCFMALMTFAIVFLVWMNCVSLLRYYLVFNMFSVLAIFGAVFWQEVLSTIGIPLDVVTFSILILNSSIGGVMSIFFPEQIPNSMTQNYQIYMSVLMCFSINHTLDEISVLFLLFALSIYDLIAVLSKYGPLKLLVDLMRKRPFQNVLPGMLYEAEVQLDNSTSSYPSAASASVLRNGGEYSRKQGSNQEWKDLESYEQLDVSPADHAKKLQDLNIVSSIGRGSVSHISGGSGSSSGGGDKGDNIKNSNSNSNNKKNSKNDLPIKDREEYQTTAKIRLGLGDFVFYSVLVSRASLYGFHVFFMSYVIVIWGLICTISLLQVYRIALPALPISILFGLLSYFSAKYCITPCVYSIWNDNGVIL